MLAQVAPAPPGREHHAQHLADRTAGEAVQGRGDRQCARSVHARTIYPPRGICKVVSTTDACNSLHRSATSAAMALEHALLVALRERPASGLELARRFDRSIGFFWHATHQQIYRVLGRMEADGWLTVRGRRPERQAGQEGVRRDRGRRAPSSPTGWPSRPRSTPLRSELAVKLRGASYGDRAAVRATGRPAPRRAPRPGWRPTTAMAAEQYPDPDRLDRRRPRPLPRPARRGADGGVLDRLARPST